MGIPFVLDVRESRFAKIIHARLREHLIAAGWATPEVHETLRAERRRAMEHAESLQCENDELTANVTGVARSGIAREAPGYLARIAELEAMRDATLRSQTLQRDVDKLAIAALIRERDQWRTCAEVNAADVEELRSAAALASHHDCDARVAQVQRAVARSCIEIVLETATDMDSNERAPVDNQWIDSPASEMRRAAKQIEGRFSTGAKP